MKKSLLLFTLIFISIVVQGQSNPIDEIFNKYSEKEGFTVITISGRMFSMLAKLDTENKDNDNLMQRLKSIRILSVEDSLLNLKLNFYTEIAGKIDMSAYEELMAVREGRDITKFLISQKGSVITELLVITGGPGGNSLISIKGDLSLQNISDISKNAGIQELKSLDNLEKKNFPE